MFLPDSIIILGLKPTVIPVARKHTFSRRTITDSAIIRWLWKIVGMSTLRASCTFKILEPGSLLREKEAVQSLLTLFAQAKKGLQCSAS